MKNYLALFTGSADSLHLKKWNALSIEEQKTKTAEGMQAWGHWVQTHKDSIIEIGGPLSKTKKINPDGIIDTHNNVTAFTIVKATNHDEAAQLFKNHPHFMIFPGDAVEVMEILPIPQK